MNSNKTIIPFRGKNEEWHEILSSGICSADQLACHFPINKNNIRGVVKKYPMRINSYYFSLIKKEHDPFWKQAVPDVMELNDDSGFEDPLSEEFQSPVLNLIHRYPDRVLFMVSNQCAVYCRFCMRKRCVGDKTVVTDESIQAGIEYIKKETAIRDVILSGGDPFLLEDGALEGILKQVRAIDHVDIIRIHTRIPCTLPQRVTENLVYMLKQFHPLFINTHFNHPDEITSEAACACALLADAGIPLGCQTVLLKGVNDDPEIMIRLMKKLLQIRVKPYYIHHPDMVKGTGHFRSPVNAGLRIVKALHGHISGLCVPHYMIDLPGGAGKVPLLPEYAKINNNGIMQVENHKGEVFEYPAG